MKNDIRKELGIYIHIPFCKRKCDYCDFISFDNPKYIEKQNIEKYIEKVISEINAFDFSKYKITTIYIGGGTPSYIDVKYIKEIISEIRNNVKKLENIEFTIEINPGTINSEKLEIYKEIGINRLSIGLQSMNDKLLNEVGRIHTYKEFEDVYNLAIQKGFENINFDLIIGLPNQTIEDIEKTLEKIKELNPNHVSIYSLILEEGTKLEEKISKKELECLDEELERQMYWNIKEYLESIGYIHYEISNFARKGKESKHNVNCWKQKEYIGFGLAAHSYINMTRYSNIQKEDKEIFEYENEIQEIQDIEEQKKEFMLLGLRMLQGVSIQEFKCKFQENPIFLFQKQLDKLVNEDLIDIDGDIIKLTKRGIDLANQVWQEFI